MTPLTKCGSGSLCEPGFIYVPLNCLSNQELFSFVCRFLLSASNASKSARVDLSLYIRVCRVAATTLISVKHPVTFSAFLLNAAVLFIGKLVSSSSCALIRSVRILLYFPIIRPCPNHLVSFPTSGHKLLVLRMTAMFLFDCRTFTIVR